MSYNISIRLDKRRARDNGKYPIKLRVYYNEKEKWYSLDTYLTAKEFDTIWINTENKNLRGSNKETRLKLLAIETRANDEAKLMTVFDFSKFEMKLFRKSSDKSNLQYHFNLIIQKNTKNGKIGTAESYRYTLNSLAEFSEKVKNCPIEKLTFGIINVDWLNEYENFMISKGKSYTTVSIYTRTLRVVFNNAISVNDISKDIYPFGKKQYQIPKSKKVKKALSSEQLKVFFNSNPRTKEQEKAKDFWFFSYMCNGMNLKDILLLEFSDIKGDKFSYYRAKTFNKSSVKSKINIYLNDFSREMIDKYGSENKKGYVFQILNKKDGDEVKYRKIKNFTRFVNQHLKKLAKDNNLPEELSFYFGRHSFTTNSIRKGASMEFISEALNHSDLNVTKNYFAGFEDKTKKEFADKLMNF